MRKNHSTFLGYRIYRKKFLGTIAVVMILCVAVFGGMLFFFVNHWMGNLRMQAQNQFQNQEYRIERMQNWIGSFINEVYGNKRLMEDLSALFEASDNQQYLEERRENSMMSSEQIRYFPAYAKRLFVDQRSRIQGITLSSESGTKVIWLQNGDICVSFDCSSPEEAVRQTGAGNLQVCSYPVRSLHDMGQTLGTMDFWIDAQELYAGEEKLNATCGIFGTDGSLLAGSAGDEVKDQWLRQASQRGVRYGWLEDVESESVFFVKMSSAHGKCSYVMVKSVMEVLQDNSYVIVVVLAALMLIAVGVLLYVYGGMQMDADFLTRIMGMLSDMESGRFDRMRRQELPVRHKENEYGMIAVALKDVGAKLQGYIETEYILKLKEQETQMRALQHQINPHFLYNTLEILRSKALLQGDRDMADAIALLGTLYRARMHKKDRITLREEFELLETYLKIMTMRFRDNFVYQTELDEEIADMETISFWLQPLAENFFTHGFDRESLYNLLIVTGHAEDGGARIEVIDNGSGIAEDRLEEIKRGMYEGNDDPDADIGLRNVYMRMNYFYRDGFTMEIGNNEEGGFRISIFIPGKVVTDVHVGDRG